VANLLNGFASVRWDDDELVAHLSKAAMLEGKGAFTPPEVAMSLQALAVLYLPGELIRHSPPCDLPAAHVRRAMGRAGARRVFCLAWRGTSDTQRGGLTRGP
jgi:hypothetical protein